MQAKRMQPPPGGQQGSGILEAALTSCNSAPPPPAAWRSVKGLHGCSRSFCCCSMPCTRCPSRLHRLGFEAHACVPCVPGGHDHSSCVLVPPCARWAGGLAALLVSSKWRWCRGTFSFTISRPNLLSPDGLPSGSGQEC